MRRIKIFIDNTIIPADIYAGQKSLSSSCQQAVKQLKVMNKSCIKPQWRMRTGV